MARIEFPPGSAGFGGPTCLRPEKKADFERYLPILEQLTIVYHYNSNAAHWPNCIYHFKVKANAEMGIIT